MQVLIIRVLAQRHEPDYRTGFGSSEIREGESHTLNHGLQHERQDSLNVMPNQPWVGVMRRCEQWGV